MTPPDPHADPTVCRLPRDPSCPAVARRFVSAQLRGLSEEEVEFVMLAASELTTNALKHGEGAIELRVTRLPDRVRVEVIDEGSGQTPQIRERSGDAHGGWGLQIVSDLALAWGCYEGTTHVWADFRLVGAQPA